MAKEKKYKERITDNGHRDKDPSRQEIKDVLIEREKSKASEQK